MGKQQSFIVVRISGAEPLNDRSDGVLGGTGGNLFLLSPMIMILRAHAQARKSLDFANLPRAAFPPPQKLISSTHQGGQAGGREREKESKGEVLARTNNAVSSRNDSPP